MSASRQWKPYQRAVSAHSAIRGMPLLAVFRVSNDHDRFLQSFHHGPRILAAARWSAFCAAGEAFGIDLSITAKAGSPISARAATAVLHRDSAQASRLEASNSTSCR